MKATIALLVLSLGFATNAHAQQEIGVDKVLGLGLILGSPIGVGGKYYFAGPTHAVDFAVATEFIGFGDDRLTFYGTYLYQPGVVFGGSWAQVPWHIGAGAQFWTSDLDDDIDDDEDADDAAFGVRVPVGLDMNLVDVPIQITGDVAAVVPFIPDLDAGFEISAAVRYYF